MDNNNLTLNSDTLSVGGNNSENGKTFFTVMCTVFFLISLAAFVLYAVMAITYFTEIPEYGTGESAGEQLGNGIALGFALVFMIIFGAAELGCSLISIILIAVLIKKYTGKVKTYGKIIFTANIVTVAVSIVSFVVAIIMQNNLQ